MPKNNDSTDLEGKHLLRRHLCKLELTPPKGETPVMTEAKDTTAANEMLDSSFTYSSRINKYPSRGAIKRRKESVLKPAKSEMDVSNEQGVGVKFNSTVVGVGETGDLLVNDNGTYGL